MIVIFITLHKGTDANELYAGFYSKACFILYKFKLPNKLFIILCKLLGKHDIKTCSFIFLQREKISQHFYM